MKILISTDSSAMIKKSMFDGKDISVFPLNIIIDGEEFLDGVTISQEQVEEAMRAGKNIKTSTPPLGEVIEYFERLFDKGYDHIIHFTISSKLSSMNDLFNNVAKQNFAGKVTVIDSYSLCSIMLSKVLLAYDEAEKGTPIDKIVCMIEQNKADGYICFVPENLTALKNGGRISPAIALIGNTIGIKPVILLKDGELQKETMTRRARKTFIEKVDMLKNSNFTPDKYDYTIVSFGVEGEKVQYVINYIEGIWGQGSVFHGIVPVNVCAHCGPGTIGLIVSPKINGKSYRDFI